MDYDNLNFCELPEHQLKKLIVYLGIKDAEKILSQSCEKRLVDDRCVEKKWCWYDEIIVTPTEIFFAPDPLPRRSVLNFDDLKRFDDIITLLKND